MDFERKRITDSRDRRAFIGGSDARTIMGDDEQALLRLWREKRGEGEPEDLSGNLVVQLGAVTEDLNRRRYELNTGLTVGDVQKRVKHPILRWMGATLDGVVEGTGALFESKFMLPWQFSEEGQHNECQARRSLTGHLSFFGALPLGFRNRTPRPPPVSSRNSIPAASIAFLQLGLGIVRYPRASAAARERLLAELTGVVLGEDLDRWAYRCLPTKDSLTTTDARLVEEAFQVKLATLAAAEDSEQAQTGMARIDKSLLTIPVPRRLRDKTHLRFVAKQPCLVCGRQPCDPHHLRFAQYRGLGQKVSDEFTVPLCRAHHRELHRAGKEVDWWARIGIEPTGIAGKLWIETHPLRDLDPHQAAS